MPQTNLGDATVNIKVNVQGLSQVSGLRSQLNNLQTFTGRFANALRAGGKELTKFGHELRQLSFVTRDAGRQFLLFGAAITAVLAGITIEGSQFEQSVANVVSVLSELQAQGSDAADTVERLSGFFLNLAETTKFTAVEITGAAEQLALAGFSAKEIEASLGGIADLAAAAGDSASDTALAAANILRAFELEANEISRVADVLTAAFTNSNTTLESLRQAFKLVAPAASAFGLAVEDVSTALGILGNTGLQGGRAGTSLARLITQLATDVEQLDELLGNVGLSQQDVDPTRNSLQSIIAVFEDLIVSGKLTETQLAQVFDQRALRALLNLIGQGSIEFDELNEKIELSAGLARQVAETRMDTLIGDVLKLRSAFSSLLIETFQAFSEDLRGVVQGLTGMVKGVREFVAESSPLIRILVIISGALAALLISVGGLLTLIGIMAASIAALVIILGTVGPILLEVVAAVAIFAASVALVTGVIWGMITASRSLLRSLGVIETSAEKAAALKEYADAFSKVKKEAEEADKKLIQFASTQQKVNDILRRGGTISQGEFSRLQKLVDKGGSLTVSGIQSEIEGIYREIDELVDKSVELQLKAFEEGRARSDEVKAGIAATNDEVELRLALIDRLKEDQDFLNKISFIVNIDTSDFEKEKDRIFDELSNLKLEETLLAEKDFPDQQEEDRLEQVREQIKNLEQLRDVIATFTPESFAVFKQAALASGQIEPDLLAALQAALDFNKAQQENTKRLTDLRKAAVEARQDIAQLFDDIDSRLRSSVESEFKEIEDLRQRLISDINTLTAQSIIEGNFKEVLRLSGEYIVQLTKINKLENALFESRDEHRDARIRDLRRQRAEVEKDVAEATRLLREERGEKLKKEIDDLFTLPETAAPDRVAENEKDRLAFIKEFSMETDRLVDQLKDQLTESDKIKDTTEKITRKASERNEIEKSIAQQLTQQVRTIEQARLVARFARAEQNRRIREARLAGDDQVRAENRLFDLIKRRAELESKGLDIERVNDIIRLQQKRVENAQDIAQLLEGQAGFQNNRVRRFETELSKVEAEAARVIEQSRKNSLQILSDSVTQIAGLFSSAPVQWINALITAWDQEAPRFIQALIDSFAASGMPQIPGNVQAPQNVPQFAGAGAANPEVTVENFNDNRNITFNIEGTTDPEQVAIQVRDMLFNTPPRARGFLV